MTVRVTGVATLPDRSLTEYVIVNVPSRAVFTGFTTTIRDVRSPSVESVAVAPASA